ncbi:peptidylprolyl isomerase [Crenobacter intestini]|uniref:peptidylprolyl isomerase n=1 Tax=Crenobacter intestini TaxID=2563443 RepID=A0A4T0UJN5_9NEIS|nr:peptidylprolyl isomerase [Crenobacter intestini]TIC78521.1 peptidylprolyl isomerase [Crenobacter intestini]
MPVIVNGVELTDAEIEAALPDYQDTANPVAAATTAWVVRRVLIDAADAAGIDCGDSDAAIDALLAREVKVPIPDDEACRRHYAQHRERFTVGELVEVDHILFQVTDHVDLTALTERAEAVLSEVQTDPSRFAELAARYSNCPSGTQGGNLGQIRRGETVPEFERAVFALADGELMGRLLPTRFGLHIVRAAHREPGMLLPYEAVSKQIEDVLAAASRDAATRQYLKRLVGAARISGIDLPGAETPLVQ